MSTVPTSFKRSESGGLRIEWSDGHVAELPLEFLRDECPCAGCKGEMGLLGVYHPPPPQEGKPGQYGLKKVEPVGKYAVNLIWEDGHDTGIYSWSYLLEIENKRSAAEN
ncbi:MAG: hypothetical protein CL946_08900 [Ectothiorhodospiraceae bacterium]|nr:hypothetical protein [Ectothiorhodospiraceae bacterium]